MKRLILNNLLVVFICTIVINALIYIFFREWFSFVLLTIPFIPLFIKLIYINKLKNMNEVDSSTFFRKYSIVSFLRLFVNVIVLIILLLSLKKWLYPILILYIVSYFVLLTLDVIELKKANSSRK